MKNRLMVAMFLLLLTQLGYAGPFDPVASDISVGLLNKTFGGLMPAGGTDSIQAVMQVFNGAVLILGGVLASYTILAGTLGTAHDGEMLGKKFSSVWVPIRTALGTSLIFPVNGYCIIQHIVMALVLQGIGLADSLWTTYTGSVNMANITTQGIQAPDAKSLGSNAFQSLVCMKAYSKIQVSSDDILNPNVGPDFGILVDKGTDKTVYYFGDRGESMFDKDMCGQISLINYKAPTIQPSGTLPGTIQIDISTSSALAQQVADQQKQQLNTLLAALDPLATQLVTTGKEIDPAPINAAIQAYEKAVGDTATAQVKSIDGFSSLSANASKGGWASSFAYFIQLGYLYDSIQKTFLAVPTATGPTGSAASSEKYSDQFVPYFIPLQKTLTKGDLGVLAFGGGIPSKSTANQSIWNKISDLTNKISPTDAAKGLFVKYAKGFTGSPGEFSLITMKRLGNLCLEIAGGGWAASGIAFLTIGTHGGVASFLSLTMGIVTIPLLMMGFLLAFYLPMMPAMMGIGIVVGWFVNVAIGIFASPLWVIGHLNPHGDDFIGGQAQGYKLILSLTLRPALTVLGVIVAFVGMIGFGDLINNTFLGMFSLSQVDSGLLSWLVAFIAGAALYFLMMHNVIKKLLELPHVLPDEILSWIGGGGHSVGDYAHTVGGQGAGGSTMAGAIINPIGNKAQGGIGKDKESGGLLGKFMGGKGGAATGLDSLSPMSASQNLVSGLVSNGKIDNPSGASIGDAQAEKQFGGMISALGGAESKMGKQLLTNLADSTKDTSKADMTPSQMLNDAMGTTLKSNFGGNARNAIAAYTGGEFSGEKFDFAVSQFKEARNNLANNADISQSDAKDMLRDASVALSRDLKTNTGLEDGSVTAEQIFEKHLGQFKDVQPVVEVAATEPAVTVDPAPVVETPQTVEVVQPIKE